MDNVDSPRPAHANAPDMSGSVGLMPKAASGDEGSLVDGPSTRFGRSLAVVIGINTYGDSIASLRSAVVDAQAIAEALRRDHAFEIWCLLEDDAQLAQLLTLLHDKLPGALGPDDRLLFYFAGHGIALDSEAGPAGYLIPARARRSDRDGFLPMRVVHAALTRLAVRHAFVILDCCFAGAFRWAHMRDTQGIGEDESKIYRERYDRYIESPAWQVLTSASSDQRAFDMLANTRDDEVGPHSPFALALLAGLAGAADYTNDNVITADELAIYVRERVAPVAASAGSRQVPQFFAFERHDAGQFVFQVPNHPLALAPAPALNDSMNPYRGLEAFSEQHHALFFGRQDLVEDLVRAVHDRRLTVVVGPSGSGKSSLVQAGLVPALRAKSWTLLPAQRPGRDPLKALGAWATALDTTSALADPEPVAAWTASVKERARAPLNEPWVIIIDQFEELLTHRTTERDRLAFLAALAFALELAPSLHIVVTVRSDAEPQFHDTALAPWWTGGRFPMRAMTRRELRQTIERPAALAVLHFHPSHLVEQLLDDVALVPAPLPLLSFALSELYRCCWVRWLSGTRDRVLHENDYLAMGSVARALTQRATAVHDQLVAQDAAYANTIRNVFTRMISLVGGEVARRRVRTGELVYKDIAENQRVAEVLQRFHEARLISLGNEAETDKSQDRTRSAYAEPMHDELVRGWIKVSQWLDETDVSVGISGLASLGDAVRTWNDHGQLDGYLWNDARVELLNDLARKRSLVLNADETWFVECSVRRRRRRRARLIGGLLSGIVVLAAAASVALWQWRAATESAQRASEQADRAQHLLAQSYMEAGRQLVVDDHPQEAMPYLLAARQNGEDGAPLRMMFYDVTRRLPLVPALEHQDAVLSAAFSPDGLRIVTASYDKTAQVWDAVTGAAVTNPLQHQDQVESAVFSPDGTRVLTASRDRTARVWDATTGKPLTSPLQHQDVVQSAVFSPDGTRVVTASSDKTARVWDAVTGKPLTGPLQHQDAILHAAFNPDGTRVVTASMDKTVRIWDATTGQPLTSPLQHQDVVQSAAFSPDGTRVVTASDDKTARVWDATTGQPLTSPLQHQDIVQSAAFSPDGTRVVTASDDKTARVWDATTGQPLTIPLEHQGYVHSATFSPDGTRVVTASGDNTARVWDAATGKPFTSPLEHQDSVWSAAFSSDGTRVITASSDKTARVWDAATGKSFTPLAHRGPVVSAAFSPDGTRVVTASGDNTARVWDAATGKPLAKPLEHQGPVVSAAFSPDGTRVITASMDKTARVWDAATGKPLTNPLEHQAPVMRAAFSADGSHVVTASWDTTAQVWDVATGKPVNGPFKHQGPVSAAAFSPDGARVITASMDKTARIWDAATGKAVTRPLEHQNPVLSAAFSPDGTRVVTASYDKTARVWDAATGRPLTSPLEHQDQVEYAAFSLDGTRVVTASYDKTARVWDAATGRPLTSPLEHQDQVEYATFSPDGTRVVTASDDKTMQVWDAATGKALTKPLEHQGRVVSATFSPDGTRVITASSDNSARIWTFRLDQGTIEQWSIVAKRSPFVLKGVAHVLREPLRPRAKPAD